ncbi:MAG TPA: serine O-acetyltransferase [Saprospiraceae bacterium]|nr:serine O-acetyltransferase [Saprospiraceae bacterium]HMQ84584.1 serine O-acetyltransferase [Saprospiraceae bacterium]
MKEQAFIQRLYDAHEHTRRIPSPSLVCKWLDGLLKVLFPEHADKRYSAKRELEQDFLQLKLELFTILNSLGEDLPEAPSVLEEAFMDRLPDVYDMLLRDAKAILIGDPAAISQTEVIRTYPGFLAIAVFRLAHEFYRLGVPLIPRILTEHIHSETGIDIHPGANIGSSFCIDHGTGVVIGETVEIGDNVKIYQGVTLGALSVKKNMAKTKRHPTIEDNVIIYSGATILGGETVIGHDSIIGGNVWLTESVPAFSRIYYEGSVRQKVF